MTGKNRPVRLAIEGCGHGTLHAIYASIEKTCEAKGWDAVDLVIIGGDFQVWQAHEAFSQWGGLRNLTPSQAARNTSDLNCMSVPRKYRELGDFHEYYSGARTAPYLTVFVGGNHEASNYLFELFYGGWVAPNIYFLGAANVVRFGPLRIAAFSGIWKAFDYRKQHHERLPYSQDDIKSAYHVRELDVRKLLLLRSQVDVGISHDWPRGVEWCGDSRALFRKKDLFEADARAGKLGSVAAKLVLERLRPRYWFSAHLHCKFSAIVRHVEPEGRQQELSAPRIERAEEQASQPGHNADEIDLGMDGDEPAMNGQEMSAVPLAAQDIPEDVLAELPASILQSQARPKPENLPFPDEITNKETLFLALDKCLPHRDFLQLLEVEATGAGADSRPETWKLRYDPEWIAISKVFAQSYLFGNPRAPLPADEGEKAYRERINEALEWVKETFNDERMLDVPRNFQQVAPTFDGRDIRPANDQPREYVNPQTAAFCKMFDIPNGLYISEDEAIRRWETRSNVDIENSHRNGHRGGYRGRGQGRGRGRGGRGGNRDRYFAR